VVYATSPPLTMALPALAAAARWRAPLVFEVRDLWPEAPIQMGALRNPVLRRAARVLERFVYGRARRMIALSPGIRDGMVAAGAPAERVALVPNAADLDLFDPNAARPERFRVSYFGTMGEANDLGAAVEAARLLGDVEFVFMGDGKRRSELERGAPSNVVFTGSASSKDQVAELAARSSACLTLFKDVPVLATNSPNKLFDTFAAGRPAIVNMDGWMRELVERNEAGLYVRAGDVRELADRLAWLRDHPEEAERMGRNARVLAEREFARDTLAKRALAVLEEASR
jgi:glycosyltransferase involved in cell wall biosynthesis